MALKDLEIKGTDYISILLNPEDEAAAYNYLSKIYAFDIIEMLGIDKRE